MEDPSVGAMVEEMRREERGKGAAAAAAAESGKVNPNKSIYLCRPFIISPIDRVRAPATSPPLLFVGPGFYRLVDGLSRLGFLRASKFLRSYMWLSWLGGKWYPQPIRVQILMLALFLNLF